MLTIARPEYLGFTVSETSRVYTLRLRRDGKLQEFHIAIANQAFLDRRVRYQDAAEICFMKLERELRKCGDSMPAARLQVTDTELDDYRQAHVRSAVKRESPSTTSWLLAKQRREQSEAASRDDVSGTEQGPA